MKRAQAERFAALALAGIEREFPYSPGHVMRHAADLRRPRALHPAFYGCYDWHSSVHGHWLLAHLLRRFPDLPRARAMRGVLARHLTVRNLKVEARYLEEHPGFERPYGWAWLLKLADELRGTPEGDHLTPLVKVVERRYLEWLPKQTYPIRTGTHTNTAFGLAFALDHARAAANSRLEKAIVAKSLEYYGSDRDYPAGWEPGGNDFFSPCLVEADLMRRVVPDFSAWFKRYLPRLPASLRAPAKVSDRGDGQLAHLDGLNLSRAWCFYNLGMRKLGDLHLRAGMKGVASGRY